MISYGVIRFKVNKIVTAALLSIIALTACAGSKTDDDLCARLVLQEKNDEAVPLCTKMLDLSIEKHGFDSANTTYYELLLSQAYLGKGMYAQAEPLLEHVLKIIRQNLPNNNMAIMDVVTYLNSAYVEQGKYQQSEKLLLEMLSFYDSKTDKNTPILLELNSYLMSNYSLQGKVEDAALRTDMTKNLLARVGDEALLSKAEKERYQAEIFFYQSTKSIKNKQFPEALRLMQETLKWDSLSPKENSIEIAYDYIELAEIYSSMGNQVQAVEYAKKSLPIIESQLDLSSSKYKRLLQRYEKIINVK